MPKKSKALNILITSLLIILLIKIISFFYVDYSWFKDLGYTQLYTTPIIAKLQIGLISFLLYFMIISTMGYVGFRVFLKAEREGIPVKRKFHLYVIDSLVPPEKDVTPPNRKKIVLFILLASFIFSLFFALSTAQNGWMKLLEFTKATSFGLTEAIFNKDVSYYIFKIPFLNFAADALTFFFTIIFIVSLLIFPFTGLIKFQGNLLRRGAFYIPRSIRGFWAVLVGLLFIALAWKKYLSLYSLIYSQMGYVYGAGYTDIHVTVPLLKALAILALLCSAVSFAYLFVNDHRLIAGTFIAYIAVSTIGAGVQGLVQYNVSNNEYVMEKPYIEHEIKFTRIAYNLDKVKVLDYPGTTKITLENIKRNQDTMDNIRLNDPEPLKTVLSQNQGLRYYYRFNDIDIDRYKIDGKYRQVLLGPREISEDALTEKAGTFVNLAMRYTHGFGATATLANEIDDSGYARLILKDIPPVADVNDINIKEPRIYFGELTNDDKYGYVIGNTGAKEFDYPQGDNNVENSYHGKTGLKLFGLNKFFLSAYFDTFRLYMAGEINENSKLLMKRNIIDRVTTLMPYLRYDNDPYLVIAKNGKMYWILDAYTYSDKFPYSAPVGDINYIRNSVKAVIDPYNGTVDFYVFDKNDPVLKTIAKIFPGVFKNSSDMPSNLLDHIRYPEDYFYIQSNVLLNFHVNNPSVFYNREDTWDIAKKIENGSTNDIRPYYSVMKLPGEKNVEFTLMLPFTPASRQEQHRNNLVAWLAARNDSDKYGELVLYKVPKNVEVQGPLMIDSLIDQDTNISGKMTLWSQGGSEVIRGNLLAVPIDGGFVYVEPIYIKAQQQGASIPQMQAIVFAVDKKIIMVETNSLDKTVAEFFAREGLSQPTPAEERTTPPGAPRTVNPKEAILRQIELLKQQLQDLEKQVRSL